MSHIDTINHSHIGSMAGIAVYHPLENDREFGLTPRCIVIGGGSGEHSMLIIEDIDACVKNYIFYYSEDLDDYNESKPHRSFWSIEDAYHFFKNIKKSLKSHKINTAERYIDLAIAEFLIFSGSHLVDPKLIQKALSIKPSPELYAISQNPVGYPIYGRMIVDDKVKFGYSFEDEKSNLIK